MKTKHSSIKKTWQI